MKERDIRDKSLKELIEESERKEKETGKINKKKDNDENLHNNDINKNSYKKLKDNFISESLENNLKVTNADIVIPKTKVKKNLLFKYCLKN